MTMDPSAVLSAAIRQNFGLFLQMAFRELGGAGSYSHNWHIDAIDYQLARIRTGSNRRLIVTMPPRYLKSIAITIAWVAWMLGHNPALKFLCVSYNQDLASDHAARCLKLMQCSWYRRAFPSVVLKRLAVDDFSTAAGGGRMSTSIEGTTTGFGADIIIVDDPMKAQDTTSEAARTRVAEWFDTTLIQRLNDQEKGSIIVVMQRLHEADLAGVLIEQGGWHELRLPAIATKNERVQVGEGLHYRRRKGCALHPARNSLAWLESRRLASPFVYESQFQQNPVPFQGNIFQREWLKTYKTSEINPDWGEIIQSWDTASKDNPFTDFSVCITAVVQQSYIYILDVYVARLTFPRLKEMVIELAREYRARTLLIEDASSGQELIQELYALSPPGVPTPIARRPEGSKLDRAIGATSAIQSGRLLLPDSASWLGEFTAELLAFPNGKHDDQVDALTQMLSWLRRIYSFPAVHNAGPIEMTSSDDFDDDDWITPSPDNDPWSGL